MELNDRTAMEEASRCLMCLDAPCTGSCPASVDTAAFVRSIRMRNVDGASERMSGAPCDELCPSRRHCEMSCVRRAVDRPVMIGALRRYAAAASKAPAPRGDISVDFLGVRCENPFFLASSPVAGDDEMIGRAFEAGWAGAFYKTIGFFVADECSPRFDAIAKESTPWIGFRNMEQISDKPTEVNFENIARLKRAWPNKVIVASIMGRDADEWRRLAKMSEQAGADMIEGNFSCPQMTADGMGSDVGTSPELVREYTAAAVSGASIPFIAKMTPNITDITVPAAAAVEAGARGIAAINTVKSITSIDLAAMKVRPSVAGRSSISGYSGAAIKPIALRFAAELASSPSLRGVQLSGIGGVETWRDAAELLALGCRTVQVATAVMQYGYRIVDDLIDGLARYVGEMGHRSLDDMIGAALPSLAQPSDIDRRTVSRPSFDTARCVGCGRCAVSCGDAGHKAIAWDAASRRPSLGDCCPGCGLCTLVCPVGCITTSR